MVQHNEKAAAGQFKSEEHPFPPTKKTRIWELDALRGLFILCVILVHLIYDLQVWLELDLPLPKLYHIIQDNGGILFVLLSGICVTLGSRSIRRGLFVLLCAMCISLVTAIFAPEEIILFGVLHLLGICMILYPLYRKLPTWLIGVIALILICLGFWFTTLRVESHYLFPLGLIYEDFFAGDYFPLFPNLGYFMMGVVLGRTLYRKKETLFPRFPAQAAVVRFFSFCGRHSLWIYLIHQPVFYLIFLL